MSKKLVISLGVIVLLLFPILTNYIMNTVPPFGNVNTENIWIGYFASYFGGVFGGLIAGLLTYIGVKITIKDNREIREEQAKKDSRATLLISEIYDGSLNLTNIKERKGRIIITEPYKYALDNNISDGKYNFIVIDNLGPGKVLNCDVSVSIKFEVNDELYFIKTFLSTIIENERVYIPIDKIPDKRKYRIVGVSLYYETMLNEQLLVKRKYEKLKSNQYLVKDEHFIKDKDGEYNELFSIKGSSTEWIFLE